MTDLDHPCILKAGYLSLKRSPLAPVKKYLILCAPLSTRDIQEVYSQVFHVDPKDGLDNKSLPWLGNIACAAVKGTPLLIVLSSETSSAAPTFIQFSDIRAISDEGQLRSACNFALHVDTKPYDYRFSASSSTDYQQWNSAFGRAMSILTDRTMGGIRDSQNSSDSNLNAMLFDFEQQQQNDDGGSVPRHVSSVPSVTATASRDWGTTSSSASPPSSPMHHNRRQKVPILPHHIAPPSMSRKYTLGQDRPQSPGGSSMDRPSSSSTRSGAGSPGTLTSPRTSDSSRYDLPPDEIIDAPEH